MQNKFRRSNKDRMTCSTTTGDADAAECARYCRASQARRHCRHCLCAACDFCATTTTHTPATGSLLAHEAGSVRGHETVFARSRAALHGVRRRFLTEGVVMRVFECSLAGCAGDGESVASASFMQRCVRDEVESVGATRPASFLRADLPAALFAGGRCVNPTAGTIEEALYPTPAVRVSDPRGLQDEHGWRRRGFAGHNISQAGIGWIFAALPEAHRGAAFAHDAWAYEPRAGVRPAGSDLGPAQECSGSVEGDGQRKNRARTYAAARLAARVGQPSSPIGPAPHPLQRRASAHKWGFVNSSWNCLHTGKRWEHAFDEQREYATLLASGGAGSGCGARGGGRGGSGGDESSVIDELELMPEW